MQRIFGDDSFLVGATSAIIAVMCFSINDVAIKFLSGNYALHQVVLFRSVIGLFFLLIFILPFSGGWRGLSTNRLGIHFLRGCCVVFANMSFFLGLAALPLAEGVAIFFISPMVITIFSVIFLKETVGP
jgi:drug/metabolite transporter (DMT)-like permease